MEIKWKELSKTPSKMTNMTRHSIPVGLYIEASQVFHWATKRHFQLWFTGEAKKRHRRTEAVLARLAKSGKLRSVPYGKKLIYAAPKNVKGQAIDEFSGMSKVVHGLACTECLVRFYRSRLDGVVVAERYFYGLGSVPEWGIIYPNGKILLFEFCTKSNFYFTGNMKGKLEAYRKNLENIERKFQAKAVVVFVIDVSRATLERYVGSLRRDVGSVADAPPDGGFSPLLPLFFTDYKAFLEVPIGSQLVAPIYFWIADAKAYQLSQNAGLETNN